MMTPKLLILLPLYIPLVLGNTNDNLIEKCQLSDELKNEIKSYQTTVDAIINELTSASLKGGTYAELAKFVDKFGSRMTGTRSLENSIDYILNFSRRHDFDNVHAEEVPITRWQRGEESATMLRPRFHKLTILGLGNSIGTPKGDLEAEVLVVDSFEQLDQPEFAAKAPGKIVLFVPNFTRYSSTVRYRFHGADKAAQYGAVACLIRSVTPFSLSTPHTGWQENGKRKIPAAAITVEDAHLLKRLQDRGERIVVRLKMEAKELGTGTSRNTIQEILGWEQPKQTVFVTGHLDSWDVGQGAVDDGGGAFISLYSLVVLKVLNLRARRTIRAVLWTGEEQYYQGAEGYDQAHKDEIKNFRFMMESDDGTFNPYGLAYAAGPRGTCIIKEILQLFKGINATQGKASRNPGTDIGIWTSAGVPGASILNENDKYFWFHHSDADTMDAEDSECLDKNTAIFASTAYIIADLTLDFPRD